MKYFNHLNLRHIVSDASSKKPSYLVLREIRLQTPRLLTEEGAVERGARALSVVPDAGLTEELSLHITHIAAPSTAYHLQQKRIEITLL